MVRFGVSPATPSGRSRESTDRQDEGSLSALYNNPKPTTPSQRYIDKIQNEYAEVRHQTDGAFGKDRGKSPFARMSPHAHQLSGGNPESAEAGSRPLSPLRATHPDEIQRRRQKLAESSFDFRKLNSPPYQYQQQLQRSASVLDDARELMRRDVLNSLEKRSTLKHFSDLPARSLGQRRVSFKLDDDQTPEGIEPSGGGDLRPESMLAPIVVSRQDAENRAPAANRLAMRPQSAKNRKRAGQTERTKDESVSSAGPNDKGVSPKRPTSARPNLDERATQSLIVLRPKSARRTASSHTMRSCATDRVAPSGETVKAKTNISPRPTVGSRASASDALTAASPVAPSSHFADPIATRARHPHSSLIHNVTLATRSRQGQTGVVDMSLADKVKTRKYLRISCHDWSCNCSHPECVTRYDFKEGQTHFDSFGPITTRKDFILPEGCRLIGARGSPAQHQGAETRDRKSVEQREMEEFLAKKPISVQRAFRISGPHWVSRKHTQRWPWKGTTWVSVCGDEITNSRSRRSVK